MTQDQEVFAATDPPAEPFEWPTDPLNADDAAEILNSPTKTCPVDCPRCHAMITKQQMKDMFTTAADADIDEARKAFNECYEKFSVNRCVRKAHLFAQILTEVGTGMKSPAESLDYSAENLKRKADDPKHKLKKGPFKYFRDNPAEADLYGRTDAHAADQQAIANRAYANRTDIGNGDIASGDGWNFRGKGFIQLTGKSNYQAVQTHIDAKYPGSGVDIIAKPADILTPRGGMISAMGYWSMKKIYNTADQGATDAVVDKVTAIVNKWTGSYQERKDNFKITAVVFRVSECINLQQAVQ
jgi:putative chitinase